MEGFDFGGREDDLGLLCGLAVTGLSACALPQDQAQTVASLDATYDGLAAAEIAYAKSPLATPAVAAQMIVYDNAAHDALIAANKAAKSGDSGRLGRRPVRRAIGGLRLRSLCHCPGGIPMSTPTVTQVAGIALSIVGAFIPQIPALVAAIDLAHGQAQAALAAVDGGQEGRFGHEGQGRGTGRLDGRQME